MMLVLAHLLPWLLGAASYAALVESPRRAHAWVSMLGYGYLLGMGFTVALAAVFRPAPQSLAGSLMPVLAVLALLAAGAAALRWRRAASHPLVSMAAHPHEYRWARWVLPVLAAWLLLRGWSLFSEVAARDVFPWDAWATWAVKSKTWYLANAWLPFTDASTWLASADARHVGAWYYPDAVPITEVWLASAAGGWRAQAVGSLWPMLWLAGLAVMAGQLRALSAPWWLAAAAAVVWGSLPLVNAHVALAGYADLPLTVLVGASGLALVRYAAGHGRAQLVLALLLALLMPAIKLEGTLWLLLIVFVSLLVLFPRYRRWLLGICALLLLWALLFGIRLPLPGLGWLEAGWGYLRVPGFGIDQSLAWRPVAGAIAEAMLLAPNWHLLWWLSGPLLIACWRGLARQSTPTWLSLGMLAAVMAIFCFTDASVWAQDLTAMNRVLMQITVIWVAWLALLIADRLPAADNGSPARPPPH